MSTDPSSIQVALPVHLRRLAGVDASEVSVDVAEDVSVTSVLDALEARFPALGGTIRDRASGRRNAYMRYFACGEDISLDDPAAPLPSAVIDGTEPLRIVGAIAGG